MSTLGLPCRRSVETTLLTYETAPPHKTVSIISFSFCSFFYSKSVYLTFLFLFPSRAEHQEVLEEFKGGFKKFAGTASLYFCFFSPASLLLILRKASRTEARQKDKLGQPSNVDQIYIVMIPYSSHFMEMYCIDCGKYILTLN